MENLSKLRYIPGEDLRVTAANPAHEASNSKSQSDTGGVQIA